MGPLTPLAGISGPNRSDTCHNALLGRFLDGEESYCFTEMNAALCDHCERLVMAEGQEMSGNRPSPGPPPFLQEFAAAYSHTAGALPVTREEDLGSQVRLALDNLYKCCIPCWIRGKTCTRHKTADCAAFSEVGSRMG